MNTNNAAGSSPKSSRSSSPKKSNWAEALSMLSLGKTKSNGTVEMSAETISGLLDEGKLSKQPDGSFRLNVELPKSNFNPPLEALKILKSDDVSTSTGIDNVSGSGNTNKSTSATGTQVENAMNMDASPPNAPTLSNPYLQPSAAAAVRRNLMEVYSLQSTVQQLMNEETAQLNNTIWETARTQARGIEEQTAGTTLNLLAGTMASLSSASAFLAQGVTALGTKVKSTDLKHKAEQIRAGLSEGSIEETVVKRTKNRKEENQVTSRSDKSRAQNSLEISLEREENNSIAIDMKQDDRAKAFEKSSNEETESTTHRKESFGKDIDGLRQAQALEREAVRLDAGMDATNALTGVQTNLASALRDGIKILGTKQIGYGKILEMWSSTAQRIAERGAQASQASAREISENSKKILQMVVGHAQTQTELGGRIWKM